MAKKKSVNGWLVYLVGVALLLLVAIVVGSLASSCYGAGGQFLKGIFRPSAAWTVSDQLTALWLPIGASVLATLGICLAGGYLLYSIFQILRR